MMKTEYTECGGFLQRDSVEHKEYAEAYSAEAQKAEERYGADLLERVLDRDNLNKAYKRVKANIVSHNLSCAVTTDKIIHLKDGVICEEGSHKELMEADGEYKRLFEIKKRLYDEEV